MIIYLSIEVKDPIIAIELYRTRDVVEKLSATSKSV